MRPSLSRRRSAAGSTRPRSGSASTCPTPPRAGARLPGVSLRVSSSADRGRRRPPRSARRPSLAGGSAVARRASRYARLVLKPRNRELLGLLPSALLISAGFTAIFIQAENSSLNASTNVTLNHASSLSLTYGALFLGLCLAAHLVIRFVLPDADPYLFPLVAVLASVGIVMVYRINPSLARQQAQWMVLGLILFATTIIWLRRAGVGVLERYRYTIAAVGIVMAVLPRFPVIGEQVNGAYLNIHFGSVSFQPAELAKVAIVI